MRRSAPLNLHYSVLPRRVSERLAIEFFTVVLPERHEAAQMRYEAIVVVALQQMYHLVDQGVLGTLRWFLGQFQV